MHAGAPTRYRRPTLTVPSPPVTAHELAQLGTHDGRLELFDGAIVLRPWPTPLHSRVARRLARDLSRAAAPPLRVVERSRLVIGSRTLLVPDLAVIVSTPSSREASPPSGQGRGSSAVGTARPDVADTPTIETPAADTPATGSGAETSLSSASEPAPLLVVEISDPGKRRFDLLKLDLYRERGVPSCWLIHPGQPGVEVYELVDGAYVQTATAVASLLLDVVRPFPVTIVPASLVDPPHPG